jgi:polynucleotide 5'-kinase involved in rRNA processing
MSLENMAELEPDRHTLPLDATPKSRASYDENATGVVTLGSDNGSYTDADSELNFKREAKMAAADDQAGPQSIAEYAFPCISVWIQAALIYHRPHAVILVMGVTGAGKTTFINCLTGRAAKIDFGMKS